MSSLILYLLPDEKELFDGLSEDVRSEWEVVEETLDTFERPEELKMRALMFRVEDDVANEALQKAQKADSVDAVMEVISAMENLSPELLMDTFFTLGATGVSALVKVYLKNAESDDDLKGVSYLTQVRKFLLESNDTSQSS